MIKMIKPISKILLSIVATITLVLCCPVTVLAQSSGGCYPGQVIAPPQPLGLGQPVPGAAVQVCSSTATGTPCSPLTPGGLFSDPALQNAISNPFTADQNGNYSFCASQGSYLVQETAMPGVVYSFPVSVGTYPSGSYTFSGNNTFSGTNTFSASNTFSVSQIFTEGSCSGALAGGDVLCANAALHALEISLNNGSFVPIPQLAGDLGGTVASPTIVSTHITSATQNVLMKASATGNMVNSSITDNGTTVSTTEAISVGAITAAGNINAGSNSITAATLLPSGSTVAAPSIDRIGFLDGTTNPTTIAGLNTLLTNTCNGSVAGWVIVPAGVTVGGTCTPVTIPSNCRLSGGGQGMTILQEPNGCNLATFVTAASAANNIQIDNITIDGNSANNTGAGQGGGSGGLVFFPAAPTHIRINNVTVQNFYGLTGGTAPCLIAGGLGNDIQVRGSFFFNCGASGHAADGVYAGGTRLSFVDNSCDTISDTCFVMEAFNDGVIANNRGGVSTNQCIAASGLVTGVPSFGVTITGNECNGGNSTTGAAISVLNVAPGTMKQCQISGNVVRDTTSGAAYLIKKAFGCGIDNNLAENISAASANQPFGFLIQDSSALTITNNKAIRSGAAGFRLSGVQNFTFTGNLAWMNSLQSFATFSGIEIQNGTLAIATTIAAGVGSTGLQTVTPGAMTNITVGVPLLIGAGPNCSSASSECVIVTAVAPTTFSAFFNQTHGAAVAVAEAQTNSGTFTGNQSAGFEQGRGINITGASDNLFLGGNDFRLNANNPGYANAATGNVRLGYNVTSSTNNAFETIDFPSMNAFSLTETTAPVTAAGTDVFYGDSTAHWPLFNANNAGAGAFVKILAAGSGANNPLQTKRVSGCATAASLNATCDTTVTWTNAFASASYTVTCTGDVVTSGVPIIQGTNINTAKVAASSTVRTISVTAAAAQFTTIDCTAVSD